MITVHRPPMRSTQHLQSYMENFGNHAGRGGRPGIGVKVQLVWGIPVRNITHDSSIRKSTRFLGLFERCQPMPVTWLLASIGISESGSTTSATLHICVTVSSRSISRSRRSERHLGWIHSSHILVLGIGVTVYCSTREIAFIHLLGNLVCCDELMYKLPRIDKVHLLMCERYKGT